MMFNNERRKKRIVYKLSYFKSVLINQLDHRVGSMDNVHVYYTSFNIQCIYVNDAKMLR